MEVQGRMRLGVADRSKVWMFVLVVMTGRPAQQEGLLCHHSTWLPRAGEEMVIEIPGSWRSPKGP